MNVKSFHLSVQGASHIRKDKECQDCSRSCSDEKITFWIDCNTLSVTNMNPKPILMRHIIYIKQFCIHLEHLNLRKHGKV